MYAVFRTGGKQYRAAKGDVLRLEKIEADEGATITFDEVLLIGEGADVKVGNPLLSGSSVSGKVLSQGKTKKVNVVKFRRRQNYLRQGSHRQFYTEVEITGISGASALSAGQVTNLRITGRFTIHGVTKNVTARARVRWDGNNNIRGRARFSIDLEDYNVSVPSIVRLKVSNTISITVSIRAAARS